MYVLVRRDLTPGLQTAQVAHASIALALREPAKTQATSNVVVLSVADESELLYYATLIDGHGGHAFFEPDVDGFTAFAAVSDGRAFSSLPLAGAAYAMS